MSALPPVLILASTSPYRRLLLQRLQLPFQVVSPGTDETALPGEHSAGLARRLASAKAGAVAARYSGALVIGSDQAASLDGELLHKPGDHDTAVRQLQRCSGRRVIFHTAVALGRDDQLVASTCVASSVQFRSLRDSEVRRYLALDKPYDCAGSFRWEGIGIALFSALSSDDPTALEGLPLIAVADMLRAQGLDPLGSPDHALHNAV